MTDKEAFEMVGERAEKLAGRPEVQKKMLKIAKEKGKKEAENGFICQQFLCCAGYRAG